MRILFNTMSLGKGGAERVINVISNNLSKDNNVEIICHIKLDEGYIFNDNISIKYLENEKFNTTSKIKKFFSRISIIKLVKLKREIELFKPDIIITFLPESSFKILVLKKFDKKIKNIPIILSERNNPEIEYSNIILEFIMKKLYCCADKLIVQTKEAKEYFYNKTGKEGIVIVNPVANEFICERYTGIRDKVIVAVGRLSFQKNIYLLIDAFDLFYNDNPDYFLNIYGDGNLKLELIEYVKKLKCKENIIFKGNSNNIKKEIYNKAMFVLSSNYEGMPNSLIEANCLGVPCISTDCPCGGPKYILGNNEYGLLVPVKDKVALARAMNKLKIESDLSVELSEKSNKAQKRFQQDYILEQWKNEILKLVEGEKSENF